MCDDSGGDRRSPPATALTADSQQSSTERSPRRGESQGAPAPGRATATQSPLPHWGLGTVGMRAQEGLGGERRAWRDARYEHV